MKKLWCSILVLAFLGLLPVLGQEASGVKTTDWKGFEKVEFQFAGRQAWYVKPEKALAGNPWVWRAHFPTWHTEMDSILLTKGFHVAFINTNDLYGHPKAMQAWDQFYDYLVTQKGFAAKVALEGVSRGGLYVYGWAKRNPDKVSCIYAEAPVCDPRSWPGGKGKGDGGPKQWQEWLKLYGLTEQESANFNDYPIKDLKGLAAFKVPILHVIGLEDKIVPPSENTDLLVAAYIKEGGPASVYPMTRGEQKLGGHHFYIEHPEKWANFIIENSVPVQNPISRDPYLEINRGLEQAYQTFTETKKGTVAFLGGSITHNPGWKEKTSKYLQERFPDTDFNFIAAGIPSLGSTPHAFRFAQDVLEKGIPDLLFVEAAVNDRGNGFNEQAQVRALEGIMRHMYAQNPKASIVLMAFADPDKNADYAANKNPTEVAVHQRLAQYYGASYINLAKEVYDRTEAGEFSWKYDFKNLHPSPYGQELYFQTIKALLNKEGQPGEQWVLPKALDSYSYDKGHYIPVQQAKKLKGFVQDPAWTPQPTFSTRPGFVNVPMLVGEHAGDTFELEFTGRAIGIAVVAGPDAATIEYSVDGKKAQTLDLFTQWSKQLHLPWYLSLSDELKPGKHRLKVKVLSQKNEKSTGNACRIVHFYVND
ncbi:lysophospholipase L1-like esterase [Dyadobacter jejuensis]|uniref:Lysophospholipase L1-like esterase n=1 Tax=Dyadobacter jejuensis TaxID=1082580 RepID=A0A316BCA8_9BACT|nr:GDSL-type esterase/lipase family protein [Dyadobacter jejuensis]PWJ60107.1 lysophospholipase L1-like esterase [Dyadobacter jejuensis]